MWHCTTVEEVVLVTIYPTNYVVTLSGVVDVQNVMFTLDNGLSPQFTLTCVSTGGPATTVTWTRDSATAVGVRRSEVVNGVTAQYANTLTVTGRLGGLYTCTVANDVSLSGDSESFGVRGMMQCILVQTVTSQLNLPHFSCLSPY